MGKLLPTVLDTKYENLLREERSLAKAVTSAVIKSRPVTVWEIMIPILFLLNFLQFKRARETFSLNFLFTKKLALEATRDMIKDGLSKEEAMGRIKDKTRDILAADKKGIYSQKIRQKQMQEMDLLIDHYRRLLEAEGKDYASMMKNAYQTSEKYTTFLRQLRKAETEVYRASHQTLRTAGASEVIFKMEQATERIRRAQTDKIFGIGS